ncbi:MAG TPA: PEP-CTERM sorting domain-containing protein [Nostocaceae cyanobacterium]|nr:PEP-CTERM sorting domain-containing protein [Nostocaceae cyanobacterium]
MRYKFSEQTYISKCFYPCSLLYVGLPNGGTTTNGNIIIDNLTIGATAVPEPTTMLGILGMAAVGTTSLSLQKRNKVTIVICQQQY